MSRELTSRRCPQDTDPQLSLGPPPFHREAEAPTQEEAQRHMAHQATNDGAWTVPSADPVEGSGFSAADFYRAAQDGSRGRPIRPAVQQLTEAWGHVLPEPFFRDLEFAVEDVCTQLLVQAFRIHPDITRPARDWEDDGEGTRQHFVDGEFQRDTTGFHAVVPEWQLLPPPGWIAPRPSLVEDAFAAMGQGTGQERANAAAVQAAVQSIDSKKVQLASHRT